MYGDWVQLSIFQAIVWITLLLFVLKVRKVALGTTEIYGRARMWRRPTVRRF